MFLRYTLTESQCVELGDSGEVVLSEPQTTVQFL